MALSQERKRQIIEEFKIHENDTGSPEVQVADLDRTHQPVERAFAGAQEGSPLPPGFAEDGRSTAHLLNYLKEKDITRYRKLIERLGLRR